MRKAGKIWGETSLIHANGALEFHRIEAHCGTRCSKHMHKFKWNGFFVEAGHLVIRVWQQDYDLCDTTHLKPGDFMQVKPGLYHSFEALKDTIAFELYWAEFNHDDIVREDVGGATNVTNGDDRTKTTAVVVGPKCNVAGCDNLASPSTGDFWKCDYHNNAGRVMKELQSPRDIEQLILYTKIAAANPSPANNGAKVFDDEFMGPITVTDEGEVLNQESILCTVSDCNNWAGFFKQGFEPRCKFHEKGKAL